MKIKITPKPPGAFYVSISHHVDGRQKKIRRTIKGSRKDAERFARQQKERLEGITAIPVRGETLGQLWPRFFREHVDSLQSPASRAGWAQIIRVYLDPAFGKLPPSSITTKRIDAWTRQALAKGYKPGGINSRIRKLGCVLRWCEREGLIVKCPRYRLLKVQSEADVYSSEDLRKILETAYDDAIRSVATDKWGGVLRGAMVYLLTTTAIRKGELIGLYCECVHLDPTDNAPFGYVTIRRSHFKGKILETTKGTEARVIPLTRETSELMQLVMDTHPSRKGPFFLRKIRARGRKGAAPAISYRIQTDSSVSHATGTVVRAAGIRETKILKSRHRSTHKFRHSLLTALAARGVPVQKIMKLAGHKKPETTMTYLHLVPDAELVGDIALATGKRQEKGKREKSSEIRADIAH